MTPRYWLRQILAVLARSSPTEPPRIPQQLTRLLILVVVLGLGLVAVRRALVPATFGELGHYRAAAVTEAMARPINYAGRTACAECHAEIAAAHSSARHQTAGCETCHGPSAAHAANPGDVTPRVPRERTFCPRCHGYDASRPTGFPQIDPVAHNPLKPCVSCHDPHTPAPPHTPSSCGACHGEIARVKAVSHHTNLQCVQCHVTDAIHLDSPRLSRPDRPRTRAFCGECHAKDARSPKEIPRIDLDTHGGHYVCWQCHYPHYPEVG